jgi:hypothetical protein
MSRSTPVQDELRWDPPAKGDWRGLHDHFPRALTAEYDRLLAEGMVHGEAVWIEQYGLPVRTIAPSFAHGRVFISAEPLVGPRRDRFPPDWLMRAVVAIAPAFRRRARAAARPRARPAGGHRLLRGSGPHPARSDDRARSRRRNGAGPRPDPPVLDRHVIERGGPTPPLPEAVLGPMMGRWPSS